MNTNIYYMARSNVTSNMKFMADTGLIDGVCNLQL